MDEFSENLQGETFILQNFLFIEDLFDSKKCQNMQTANVNVSPKNLQYSFSKNRPEIP